MSSPAVVTKKVPVFFVGGLSNRIFLSFNYHFADGNIVADKKYDVTDDVLAIAKQYQKGKRKA